MTQSEPVHDPRVLRAIAHPVRNRILGEIGAAGSMRAADVARELGIPANQASFHLRQLAKYGLVEEAPDQARDRRDRVWRATSEKGLFINLSELEQAPGGKAAVGVYRSNAAAWSHLLVDRAFAAEKDEDTNRSVSESAVKLTKLEAAQLREELDQVVERWIDRTKGRDDLTRRTYVLMQVLQPYPEDS